MKRNPGTRFNLPFSTPLLGLAVVVSIFSSCMKEKDPPVPALPGSYKQVNLVGTNSRYNPARIDTFLANAWGLAFSAGGTPWIAAQASHVSTVYTPDGNQARVPVAIPSPGGPTGGNPTGVVFNGSNDFVLSNGQPARFIFVGVDGVLSGWNAAAGNTAIRIVNNVATSAYTGLALAANNGQPFLFASNFRTGNIDVFDKAFAPVNITFKDPGVPSGYSPFNIQNIGDTLFVLYAKVGPDGRDMPGMGNGYVSMFRTNGNFIKRFASKGPLNAPWGIAKAPAGFLTDNMKTYSGTPAAILVGNFGDGKINAYDENGKLLGYLSSGSVPIVIDGLWALSFPPATATTVDQNRLYFTAGPDKEKEGLFGYLLRN